MNPIALLNNINQSLKVCSTWSDAWSRLIWLYSNKPFVKPLSTGRHQINFQYAPPINSIKVEVRDNNGSDAFIFGEVFDHQYYNLPLQFQPKTILDLGANAGFTAIFFARQYPSAEIVCVEPMPENVDLLQKNLHLNNIQSRVFPSAIAVTDGFLEMELDANDYGHKVAGIEYGKKLTGKTIQVEALSIPTLLQKLGWNRISLLKIDIEGYEAVLLKDNCDWLSLVDAICIECHEGYGEADLQYLAKSWGFSSPQLLPGTWLLLRVEESA
ncbi:FkbM family methyltransferase [Dolichospermum sp. LEGE 00240]|uniref:FkbM family methyltransferase n=1 Tax=Dolichospermum sp. LEGE 00240 TaxID=1828603 RepID=UPI001881141B|nr:FkbM family methyltransferase [Dolichospermum sp. LEGE 00240]MBE9250757.1 FkbM family methyltransferase [Dolichospermum sp. LEGE 00240]